MIKAIAENDMHMAKVCALASLTEDESKKNQYIVQRYKEMLSVNASLFLSQVPHDMQTMLVGSAPRQFDKSRYYLRDSDKGVLEDITKMKVIAGRLQERNIPYKNTTLLYGPSGTGKTEFGKYVASCLNLPFFYVSFASTIDSHLGNTAKNIHKVFDWCSTIPCVLMLDEIDCVSIRRANNGSKGADGELERTTVSIMQEFDKLPNHVTLIAATNRVDIVDEALLRRFSIRHEMPPMSREELAATADRFLAATGTTGDIDKEELAAILSAHTTPGGMMPELIRAVGKNIYEREKDNLAVEQEEAQQIDLWHVREIWETDIVAETEEDAISLAKKEGRLNYGGHGMSWTQRYEAHRAEFVGNKDQTK